MDTKKETERWFDIEKCLFEYALQASYPSPVNRTTDNRDSELFKELERLIGLYVKAQLERGFTHNKGYAYNVLGYVAGLHELSAIYTFNYSKLSDIAREYQIPLNIPKEKIIHLHGDVDNPILGIIDASQKGLKRPFSEWIKSWHENYKAHNVTQVLSDCDEIIFFGLSFGAIDYIYFQKFFNRLVSDEKFGRNKNITIFTYDNDARLSILEQLREMGINSALTYNLTPIQPIGIFNNNKKS